MKAMLAERLELLRDVEGLLIPSGSPIWLSVGTEVQLTQALGSSFTVFHSGHLVRIYGHDADALGKQPPAPFSIGPGQELSAELIVSALRSVYDPEIPVNIVDLGLIYDCFLETINANNQTKVHIVMTLTAPACGMGPILAQDVERIVRSLPGVFDVHVDVVFDPPWAHDMMTQAAKLELGLI